MKFNFDQHHAAKLLPSLQKGDEVWLHDRKELGKVQGPANSYPDRSYLVKTPTATIRRNRVQLNKLPEEDTSKPRIHGNNEQPVPSLSPSKFVCPERSKRSMPVMSPPKPPEQTTEKPAQTRSGRIIRKPARLTL